MMKDLYKMKLHDVITVARARGELKVVRVPGGWVYETYTDSVKYTYQVTSVFVPYHNEFEE